MDEDDIDESDHSEDYRGEFLFGTRNQTAPNNAPTNSAGKITSDGEITIVHIFNNINE
jgi:hypothetical protein